MNYLLKSENNQFMLYTLTSKMEVEVCVHGLHGIWSSIIGKQC